ncbi:MAG: hypothetical protein E7649_01775 [Ruminococcaceae bacterium]|nr:hypothetical protein [Oscillospiraceae bacterium]
MGFGFLLIGYIFAYVSAVGFGTYIFAGTLVGGSIMFLGLFELRKYSPTFVYALIANTLLLICSLYGTLVWVEQQFGFPLGIVALNLGTVFDLAEIAINFLFNMSVLYGIADLSRRVEYPDTRVKAFRNMIFVILFNVLQIIVLLPIETLKSSRAGLMMLLMLMQLVYTIINAALIFKCYAMICPEGQEDMRRKQSRFGFINKWNKIKDEREEQVVEQTKKYLESKLNKRNEKLNKSSFEHNKGHKKKKKK